MSKVQVRVGAVLALPDGSLRVSEAVLPDGGVVLNAVLPPSAASSREALALALCAQPAARAANQFSGYVEVEENDWLAAKTPPTPPSEVSAPAASDGSPADDAAVPRGGKTAGK